VIDGVEEWRQTISEYLDNQRYTPIECCDLPAATAELKRTDLSLGLAGICIDLRFGPKDSVATVAGKIPEWPAFFDRVRHRYPDVPMLILGDDEEAGHSAANGLNLVGLHAAFIIKDVQELHKELPGAIRHVFGRKQAVQVGQTLPPPSRTQGPDSVSRLLMIGMVATLLAGALGTWAFKNYGRDVIALHLAFALSVFIIGFVLILRHSKDLSALDVVKIIREIMIHLNPLNAFKHGKQDRKPDNETK
jgi:hypothetical protein